MVIEKYSFIVFIYVIFEVIYFSLTINIAKW